MITNLSVDLGFDLQAPPEIVAGFLRAIDG
jgi:hypothetical protein